MIVCVIVRVVGVLQGTWWLWRGRGLVGMTVLITVRHALQISNAPGDTQA
jgi:hypothetical protein